MWQQLELSSELETNPRNWGRKWPVDFNAGKNNWFCFTGLITQVLLMWKCMGLFLRKNNLLRCWGWLYLLNSIGALTLSLLLKLSLRILEPWVVLWSFLLQRLLCVSINLLYTYGWNTVVTSGLVPLVATWNFKTSFKNEYAGLLLLLLLWFSWTLGSSSKCGQLNSFLLVLLR